MKDKMNKIHNIDCLEFMKQVPDDYFDLVLTDPPYNTTKCDWEWDITKSDFLKEAKRISNISICFGAEPFSSKMRLLDSSFYKYDWIWEKPTATGHLNAEKQPLRAYENILVFYKQQPYYNPIKTQGHEKKVSSAKSRALSINRNKNKNKVYNNENSNSVIDYESTERYPRNVLLFSTDKQKIALHPTQKPTELILYLLRTYTKKGFKVFDPFMGSGTTAIACKSLGLEWCGCELEADYVEIANKRLEAVQGSLF